MILLDYKDRRPIYEQVIEKFQQMILCGALQAGEAMPSVRSLAMELSLNPNTIQRAYTDLENSGFVYTVSGRGCFVSEKNEASLIMEQNARIKELKKALREVREAGIEKSVVAEIFEKEWQDDNDQ